MLSAGRALEWRFDPLAALRRWPADRPVALLHSGRVHPRWARWSILAEPVGRFLFTGSDASGAAPRPGGRSRWVGREPAGGVPAFEHHPIRDLRAVLPRGGDGLWIGSIGYDVGRWIERLPRQAADDRRRPVVDLGWCPGFAVYDGVERRWRACGAWSKGGVPDLESAEEYAAGFAADEPRSNFTRDDYEAAVARVIEYIRAGDVFQVNLAQRFTAALHGPWPGAPRALFGRLAAVSPAWYGAYIEAPADDEAGVCDRVIASTSPELFLEVGGDADSLFPWERAGVRVPHGNRHVVTRPIKGTRPASVSPDVLRDSEKDTAELNMIVDLMRNDLGRVCDYGSVRVTEPRTIESHPTIHHGVATIEGRLHPSRDLADLLRATMPGGSVTGAPKVRAMQIIDELEPVRRGPYCGSVGWLTADRACLNIAIRTMCIERTGADESRVDFSVGGGIVADSQPASEYEETLDKAAAMMRALRAGDGAATRATAVSAGQDH